MLKTLVAMGNISRDLLNLIKILILVMFKDSSPSQFLRSYHIFFLVHQLRLLLTLTFVSLPYLFG